MRKGQKTTAKTRKRMSAAQTARWAKRKGGQSLFGQVVAFIRGR